MNPNNLKYSRDHEWIKVDGKTALVGITHFAQKELGDIVYVEIETLNTILESGQIFGTIEAVKTVSDLFMPITGKIIEINENIVENPELVNTDPYGEGWMIKLEISNAIEINNLLDSHSYEEITG